MDFSMNYYLRLSWIDPKLAFKPEDNLGRHEITLETRDITGNFRLDLISFKGKVLFP